MFRWGGAVSSGVFRKYNYSDVVASIAMPLIAVLIFVCAFIHTPILERQDVSIIPVTIVKQTQSQQINRGEFGVCG